jgi:hypothetical protein
MMSVAMMAGPSIGATVLEHFGPTALWTGAWGVGTLSVVMLALVPNTSKSQV